MFFVLSTGRCGTTLLFRVMSSIGFEEISHQKKGSRIINILGNAAVHGYFSHESLNQMLVKQFGNNGVPLSTTDPLRSIPLSFYILETEIKEEIKIIHLVRDPRNFVTSFMNWKKSSLKRTFLHHMVPLWQPDPWLTGDVSLWGKINMSKFEHFCWIWNFKNNYFQDSLSDKQNYMLVKFEDLIADENRMEKWTELWNFMELDRNEFDKFTFPKQKVNKSGKTYFSKWQNWSSEQAKILDHWCGDLMKKMGYGFEKEWQGLLR